MSKPYIRPEFTSAPKQWPNWLRKAGLTHRVSISTQVFCASQMMMAGAYPTWLSKQLGHTDWGDDKTNLCYIDRSREAGT